MKESLFNAIENTQRATTLSSPEELMELWGLANGQAVSEEAADTYTLELSW